MRTAFGVTRFFGSASRARIRARLRHQAAVPRGNRSSANASELTAARPDLCVGETSGFTYLRGGLSDHFQSFQTASALPLRRGRPTVGKPPLRPGLFSALRQRKSKICDACFGTAYLAARSAGNRIKLFVPKRPKPFLRFGETASRNAQKSVCSPPPRTVQRGHTADVRRRFGSPRSTCALRLA